MNASHPLLLSACVGALLCSACAEHPLLQSEQPQAGHDVAKPARQPSAQVTAQYDAQTQRAYCHLTLPAQPRGKPRNSNRASDSRLKISLAQDPAHHLISSLTSLSYFYPNANDEYPNQDDDPRLESKDSPENADVPTRKQARYNFGTHRGVLRQTHAFSGAQENAALFTLATTEFIDVGTGGGEVQIDNLAFTIDQATADRFFDCLELAGRENAD